MWYKIESDLLGNVWEPLGRQGWPIQGSTENHVIEKGRILFPSLVFFVDDFLFGLGVFLIELLVAHYMVTWRLVSRPQLKCMRPTIMVVLRHFCHEKGDGRGFAELRRQFSSRKLKGK